MAWTDTFTRDLGWKLLSLVIAVAIYATLWPRTRSGVDDPSRRGTQSYEVEVGILAGADHSGQFTVNPRTVTITLRGPKDTLDRTSRTQVHAYVNLVDPGTAPRQAKRLFVQPIPGLEIAQINPSQVLVERVPSLAP